MNDTILDYVPHQEAIFIINDRNILKKIFKFMSSAEYYRRKTATSLNTKLIYNNKNNFLSIIRRAKVNMEKGIAKRFVEYEIACQIRLNSDRVEKEIVYKWSVWRRYSEFEQLHKLIQKSFGWLMLKLELPVAHTFVFDKFSTEFIEQRR